MKQIYSDLWQSQTGDQFGLDLKTYLLKTKSANVLIYYTNAEQEMKDIEKLGGAKVQFISHHHELQKGFYSCLEKFQPDLIIHENAISKMTLKYDRIVSISQDREYENLSVLETLGHTNNSLCLYYESPSGKNYLFAGDTIYLDKGEWNILMMQSEGGNIMDMKNSLKQLRQLKVDVICPSVALGKNKHVEVSQPEWHNIIDRLLEKLPG